MTTTELIFCMKCKARTETVDEEPTTMKNGRSAIQGKCAVCAAGKFRFVAKSG